MKNAIKKILLVCTVFFMIFSSANTVGALTTSTSTGTITLNTGNQNVSGKTFNVYRLMDATVKADTPSQVSYTINKDFANFFTESLLVGSKEETLDLKAYDYISKNLTKTEFHTKLKEYINASLNNVQPVDTLTETKLTSNQLPYGYYMIENVEGTYKPSFTTLSSANQNIYLKGTVPTVDKKVNEKDLDSAQLGDTLTFKVVSMVPNMTGLKDYKFVLKDTFSNGLTVTQKDLNLKVTIENGSVVSVSDYTVNVVGQQLTVTFNNFEKYNADANKTIIFEYQAILNNKAVVDKPETNTVFIEYGNDPVLNKTNEDKVNVVTNKLEIHKTDGEGHFLKGAEFTISRVDTVGNTQLKFIEIDSVNGVYRVATSEDLTGAVDKIVTPDSGKIVINGLDEGDYIIEEIKAPDGFNKLKTPKSFTVKASTIGVDGVLSMSINTSEVVNKKGILLPETGGMGTMLFTAVGAIGILAVAYSFVKENKKNK